MSPQTLLLKIILIILTVYYLLKMLSYADKGNLAGTIAYLVMMAITFIAYIL